MTNSDKIDINHMVKEPEHIVQGLNDFKTAHRETISASALCFSGVPYGWQILKMGHV